MSLPSVAGDVEHRAPNRPFRMSVGIADARPNGTFGNTARRETMTDFTISPENRPAHIEETIQSIAQLHAEHHQNATRLQRATDRTTAFLGHSRFISTVTILVIGWIGLNLLLAALGYRLMDPPPFTWLGGAISLVSFYMVILILASQRRADDLADRRQQLTLQLAILGERKTSKVIQLLEEIRRDNPLIPNRVDGEANAMTQPADPSSVLNAIRETNTEAEKMIASAI
jgi:uncharacterized membrane protein